MVHEDCAGKRPERHKSKTSPWSFLVSDHRGVDMTDSTSTEHKIYQRSAMRAAPSNRDRTPTRGKRCIAIEENLSVHAKDKSEDQQVEEP